MEDTALDRNWPFGALVRVSKGPLAGTLGTVDGMFLNEFEPTLRLEYEVRLDGHTNLEPFYFDELEFLVRKPLPSGVLKIKQGMLMVSDGTGNWKQY